MTPADQLFHAIEDIKRAVNELHAKGVDRDALIAMDCVVDDLTQQYNQLPQAIFDNEAERCDSCQYRDDDASVGWRGCNAPNCYACPSVIASGFADSERPHLFIRSKAYK